MATTIPTKKPEPQETKPSTGQALPSPADHPFFLGRMRDEFDRLFHRFTRNWPNLWEMGGNS